MKPKGNLPPLQIFVKDHRNRCFALDVVSKVMTNINTPQGEQHSSLEAKSMAFTLCKAWSICEPPRLPHPQETEACNAFLEKMEQVGNGVFGSVDRPFQFHFPLLTKYAFAINDNVPDEMAWVEFKYNLWSLWPNAWNELQKDLDAAALEHPLEEGDELYPFPVFAKRASERLKAVFLKEAELVIELDALTRNGRPDAALRYHRASVKRRENFIEMNRDLSLMALLYILCEAVQVGRWSGLNLVTRFFHNKIGDCEALERYCRVLDVEAVTSRSVVWGPENTPIKLEYILDVSESESNMVNTDTGNEEETAWWQWVEKVIRQMHQKNNNCTKVLYDAIMRIMQRIDGDGTNTKPVMAVLREWHAACECDN